MQFTRIKNVLKVLIFAYFLHFKRVNLLIQKSCHQPSTNSISQKLKTTDFENNNSMVNVKLPNFETFKPNLPKFNSRVTKYLSR